MKILEGGLETVGGYSFSALKCGIRYRDRLDLALIYSEKPCHASGVFTTNRIFAAPVRLCRERIAGPVQAVLINATNANACTGDEGYANAVALTGALSSRLGIKPEAVLMASTGIIGVQLPLEKMQNSLPELAANLAPEHSHTLAKAIMTTDTFPKEVAVSFSSSGGEFHIAGIAKGAGMIAPHMATLLAFLLTDAPLPGDEADRIFKRCIDRTLNSITIDGDMSTNDTALLLSPQDGPILQGADLSAFEEALMEVLGGLARLIVKDAEGATRLVTISLKGAATEEDARRAARAVAESLLVKTALFGKDPNWGRIACAAGYSGAQVEEKRLTISFEDIPIFGNGKPLSFDREALASVMDRREYTIHVDLGLGNGSFSYLTSDLTYDYVKINAEYST